MVGYEYNQIVRRLHSAEPHTYATTANTAPNAERETVDVTLAPFLPELDPST